MQNAECKISARLLIKNKNKNIHFLEEKKNGSKNQT